MDSNIQNWTKLYRFENSVYISIWVWVGIILTSGSEKSVYFQRYSVDSVFCIHPSTQLHFIFHPSVFCNCHFYSHLSFSCSTRNLLWGQERTVHYSGSLPLSRLGWKNKQVSTCSQGILMTSIRPIHLPARRQAAWGKLQTQNELLSIHWWRVLWTKAKMYALKWWIALKELSQTKTYLWASNTLVLRQSTRCLWDVPSFTFKKLRFSIEL